MCKITRAWEKSLKRGPKMAHGRVPSPWVVELNGDGVKRRVYEDWRQYKEGVPVPLVVVLADRLLPVSQDDVNAGILEAERQFKELWG